jgi:hypothetical protein
MKEDSMANGSSRIFPTVVALVVGFAIGWLARPAPKPQVEAQGDHLIRVHGNGTVSKPEARLGRADVAAWIADSGSLAILFPEKNFPNGINKPPFEGMTQQGTDWAVRCDNGVNEICFSGKVNPSLPVGQEFRYKYDQVIGGKRFDGMIIITP